MKPNYDLRTIFDQAASDYEKARPGYPEQLFQDIIAISKIPEHGQILEIGCGTGQASVPFAEKGYSMICLDIGKELLARAMQNCMAYPKVKFEVSSFEEWQASDATYDLVISATAFHWIPPDVGYPKAAYVLKDTGYLALFWNYHPTPYTGFFQAAQAIYREIVPEWEPASSHPSAEERIQQTVSALAGTKLYDPVNVKRYPWERDYNTQAYLQLLNTYSDHRQLEESRKLCLFGRIGDLIETQYGGVVKRPYLTVLYLAKKKSARA